MATEHQLPPLENVPSLSATQRAHILDLLFEPSTQLHTLSVPLLHEKAFSSYNDLIAAVGMQLTELSESASTSDTRWLENILGSHPRLGAKKVESAQSQAEQSQLQGSGKEAEQLKRLSEQYEAKYPGLRYVIFVNGRSRPVIMEDMRKRIDSSDLESERAAAIRVRNATLYVTASMPANKCRQCARSQLIAPGSCHSVVSALHTAHQGTCSVARARARLRDSCCSHIGLYSPRFGE